MTASERSAVVQSVAHGIRQTPTRADAPDFIPMTLPALPESPLVSVFMSNYNYEQYIEPAVRSLLSQTYQHWELVVCDDGSTDSSCQVLERLEAEDNRIRAIYKENGGQASAWNIAFEHSRGEVICFLDSDDQFHSEKLARVVRSFQAQPQAGLLCHPVQPISATGGTIGEPIPRSIDSGWRAHAAFQNGGWGNWPPTAGVCIRRDIASLMFPIPELPRFRRGGADNYIANAAQFVTRIASINDPVADYRVHGGNYIGSSKPTVKALTNGIKDAEAITSAVASFVADTYSPELSRAINMDRVTHFWEWMLGLYILQNKPADGVDGYQPDQMLAHLPRSRRLYIWKFLLAAPSLAGKRLFRLWWGVGSWKRFTRPATSRLGVGQHRSRVAGESRKPVRAIFLHRDLPYHGGVPQSFLNVARHADTERINVTVGSFRTPSTEMVEHFTQLNVPVRTLDDNYAAAIPRLRRVIGQERIDTVVCGSFKSYVVAKVASAGTSTQVIFWVPSIPIMEGRWRQAAFRVMSRNDPMLYISKAVKAAHHRPWHKGPAAVVYYGIDDPDSVDQLNPYPQSMRASLSIPEDATVIGYTAEFVEWKNHQLLIRAFSALSTEYPHLHLMLIGTGELESAVRDVAHEVRNTDRIHFLGARPDGRRMLGLMDIYAHPSNQEGFGLVVAEAMLAGVPVVAANAGALAEFVIDRETGLLFDPFDQQSLEEALVELIENPQTAQALAQRGRSYCLDHLSPAVFAENMMSFLERVNEPQG